MTQEDLLQRWPDAERILDELIDLPPDEQRAKAVALCEGDPGLLRLVTRLLDEATRDALAPPPAPPSGPAPDDALPARVGPFRILGQLGRGGMGWVLRAVHDGGGPSPEVALKLLDVRARSGDARRRFDRERETLARLQHPNIARLIDGGVADDGTPYLVMELVDGVPLDAYCDRERLDVPGRLRLFLQICSAVEYAHARFVVHRDIKPANVLVDRFGQAKLLDFGIAKWIDDLDDAGLTRTEHRVLTPANAAPEQYLGTAVTVATDVYQLGLFLYELLSGTRAHAGHDSDPSTLRHATLETDPAPPSRSAPERHRRALSGDLDAIVLKALRKEPGARYASAEAFRRDIEAYLSHRPVSALRGSQAYILRKYVRRHRISIGAAAAVVLALVAGLVGVAAQSRATGVERDRARAAEAKASAVNRFLVEELLTAPTPARAQGQAISVNEVLGNAARSVGYAFAGQPRVEADIRSTLARSYLALGQVADARLHAQSALDSIRHLPGSDRPAELRARALVAQVALEDGHFVDARRELESIAEEQGALLGDAHPDLRATRVLLSRALRRQSEPTLAERVARAGLQDASALDADDWQMAAALREEMARALLDQERGLEAEAQVRQVLEARRAHLGPAHPEVIRSLLLQGDVLTVLMRHPEALAVKQEAVALEEQVYGPNHPETARGLNSIVVSYEGLGRERDAAPLLERAYEIYKRAFGPDHPDTLAVLRNIGILSSRQPGGFARAESIYRQVLDARRRTLGDEHLASIQMGLDLVELETRAGRSLAARDAGRQVAAACEKVAALPDADPVRLARCAELHLDARFPDVRDPTRALALAERAVTLEGRTSYTRLATLAKAYRELGQAEKALDVLKEAVALPQAIQSFTTEARFVELMEQLRPPAELEHWLLERLEQSRRVRGPDDHYIAYTLRHLARLYDAQGRAGEAEARWRERIDQLRKTAPDTDWQVGQAKTELGEHLAGRRRYDEAERLLLDGFQTLKSDPYTDDTTLEAARTRIVALYAGWNRPNDAAAWRAKPLR